MAEMAEETNSYQHFYQQSPKLPPWQAFCIFVWNPEKNEFFGRTGSSWAKITVFYIIFYAMLTALCAVFFSLFFLTINYNSPKWQLDGSLIGTNPGLGFRPLMTNGSNADSTLIWFKNSNETTYQPWVNNLMGFLDGYYSPRKFAKGSGKIKSCSHAQYPTDDEVCEVDVRDWGPCNRETSFNYNKSSPCIFLKLNKIYGWTPDYYLNDQELPPEMPHQLKYHIKGISNTISKKNVWVSCDGETSADKQHIGSISYYPRDIHGFPGYYFPYLNKDSYLSPLVAVRFENPFRGIIINIECKAWAKNIKHSRADRIGSVHFELLVDK